MLSLDELRALDAALERIVPFEGDVRAFVLGRVTLQPDLYPAGLAVLMSRRYAEKSPEGRGVHEPGALRVPAIRDVEWAGAGDPECRVTLAPWVWNRMGLPVARLSGTTHPETVRTAAGIA